MHYCHPSGGTPLQAAKDKKYYENVEILDKITALETVRKAGNS